MVSVRGLNHRYGEGPTALTVLCGLDMELEPGGYAAVTGVSGAGKSTLLAILGGLEPVQQGRVLITGVDVSRLVGAELARFRRERIGFVFQDFGLLTMLSARENVEVALALARVPRRDRRKQADSLLAEVGLADRASHRPAHLSGGELQRVAMARALANHPQVLLADEPTGNLDEGSAGRVMDLLERLREERGCTLVVITHNPELAARADHRLRLSRGRLTSL
ncbi:MAG TPA: ABC transporter ATP-binding protein [Candidatus Dormibacteraeota bacterium]|nr:ABC transporter ATP-binding protein [Candidatus Dormibacteraeota bacterium]